MASVTVAQPSQKRYLWWGKRNRAIVGKILAYIFLSALCLMFMVPLFWMISTSLKTRGQTWIFPPVWIPNPIVWDNFPNVFRVARFDLFLRNTLVLVFWTIVGHVFSDSVVSFGFARVRFPGRETAFVVLLATMMIPGEVTMIPRFLMFKYMGWYNTYLPLIVPSFFGAAFNIFLLRQYMKTLPMELDEAATIDGCNRLQIFYRIIMPLCKPPLTIVVVNAFNGAWNAFMGPIIYLNDTKKYPIAVALAMFKGMFANDTNWNLMMAASLMAVLPSIIIYYFAQQNLIGGIASVGLKG